MASAVEPKKKNNVMYAFICSILTSMASIILGYDIGVMSGAALYIKKNLKITNVQLEILMGILNFYSLIGSFSMGRTSDWIGRRFTVVIVGLWPRSSSPTPCSWASLATTPRFIASISVGYGLMITTH
ncbi:unnamed protein product [Urochloa humidicola]